MHLIHSHRHILLFFCIICYIVSESGLTIAQEKSFKAKKGTKRDTVKSSKKSLEIKKRTLNQNKNLPADTIFVTEEAEIRGRDIGSQGIHLLRGENKTAKKISEVLEKQHGVRVNRLGAPGTYSNLSIRASSFNRTGVYIDGISINDPLNGTVNLEDLPLEAFDSLEIYRSYTPLHLLGVHIGGVIDLIPRKLKPKEKFYFVHGFGTSLKGGGLGIGLRLPWMLQYIKIEGSENKYDYYDNNGTPLFNTSDDRISKRKNEDYKSFGYTSYFSIAKGKNLFKILFDYFQKERGIAGVTSAPLNAVRFKTKRALAKFNYRTPFSFGGKTVLLESSLGSYRSNSNTEDPKRELIFGLGEDTFIAQKNEFSTSPHVYFFRERLEIQGILQHAENQIKKNEQSLAKRTEKNYGFSINFHEPIWGRLLIQEKHITIQDKPQEALQSILPFVHQLESRVFHTRSQSTRLGFFPMEALGLVPPKKRIKKANSTLKNSIQRDFQNDPKKKEQRKKSPIASSFPLEKPSPDSSSASLEIYGMLSRGERVPSLSESYGDGRLLLANSALLSEKSNSKSCGIKGNYNTKKNSIFLRCGGLSYLFNGSDSISPKLLPYP